MSMRMRNGPSLALTAALFATLASTAGAQDSYPNRPARFVVPFPPGGGSDVMARLVSRALTDKWGRNVIVDNRDGANGIVGTRAAANAPADGYTWLLITFFHVTNPSLYAPLPYDTIRDFSGVASIARTRYLLVARTGLPASSVKELVALAKAKPGSLTFSSAGVGGGVHLAGAYFNKLFATQMLHVPYKGAAPSVQAIMSGEVDISFQTTAVGIPALNSGKVKALAISGDSRNPSLPQIPTFEEAGFKDFRVQGWFGIAVPSGTPGRIKDKISADVATVLQSPQTREQLDKQAFEPFISTPPQVDALIRTDIERYSKLIREENIKPD